MKFIIQDWAGNVLLNGRTFDTFDDGWDHIMGELTDKFTDISAMVIKALATDDWLRETINGDYHGQRLYPDLIVRVKGGNK